MREVRSRNPPGVLVESRFVLPAGLVHRIESELSTLDSFLRATVGQGATVETHCQGVPGRQVELKRGDGAVAAITICPLVVDSASAGPISYVVAVLAWADVGGARLHWRNGPEWTIDLSTREGVDAAKPLIAEAWRQAQQVDYRRIILSDEPRSSAADKHAQRSDAT